MHPDTREVAKHMREFGLAILGRAVYDLTFSEMMAPFKHSMAVGLAAQGAEISIKARIAQEHPLLLFSQLPKSTTATGALTIKELFEHGRTIQYSELPEALWAATGIRMARVEQFQRFGKLRNQMIHFGVPDADTSESPLKFLFQVMEPLVREFWQDSIIPYAMEWDEVLLDGHLEGMLVQCGVEITPDLRAALDEYAL